MLIYTLCNVQSGLGERVSTTLSQCTNWLWSTLLSLSSAACDLGLDLSHAMMYYSYDVLYT